MICCVQVGYWLEPVLALAPFCKDPLHLSLSGVTHHPLDPSPDMLKVDKEIYPPNIYLHTNNLIPISTPAGLLFTSP